MTPSLLLLLLFLSKELFIAESKQRVRTENGSSILQASHTHSPRHSFCCCSSLSYNMCKNKGMIYSWMDSFLLHFVVNYCHLWAFSTCMCHKLFYVTMTKSLVTFHIFLLSQWKSWAYLRLATDADHKHIHKNGAFARDICIRLTSFFTLLQSRLLLLRHARLVQSNYMFREM